MKPIVAIIGRPNVGKSTLFNRLTRTRDAIVDDLPGVTRDRIFGDVTWDDVGFTLVDTGGFLKEDEDDFAHLIRTQILQAIEDADMVILVLDGKAGVSPFDTDLIDMVRGIRKPVFYTVNKIDGIEQELHLYEFYNLGIDMLYPFSAEHGYGMRDFMDDLAEAVTAVSKAADQEPEDRIKLAVVGRPNVGKSSLINKILGQQRLIVSDEPGTTRDSVDSVFDLNHRSYLIMDTAGIRRKGRVSKRLEKFSVIKALRSLDRCDVALIVLDALEGITEQDIKIAGYAYDRGCGCVFLLNKWDLVEKETNTAKRFTDQLKFAAKFLNFAPALTISALTGQRILKIFKLVEEVFGQYTHRIGTGELNRILALATERTEPSLFRGKRLKFYYAVQVSAKPPTIVCFVNFPEGVHFSYKRYLINQIRTQTGLTGTPIRMIFRKRTGKEKKS